MRALLNSLNFKFLELEKIHANHNGFDMMTKDFPSEKLDICHDSSIARSRGRDLVGLSYVIRQNGTIRMCLIANMEFAWKEN